MTDEETDLDPETNTDPETDIRPLDDTTVDRIAAGEVVERPASAVKELVENSLDADASRVAVEVSAGGTEHIRVADDGTGMTEADARAAVRQHTTSKLRDADDLAAGVSTLGFRGEALHAIGSVARVTVTTKPRGAAGAGTRLRYEGGEVESVETAGCPEGTSVEVTDLFYNTPARRKYLGTEATEFSRINRVVTRYALANPDVAVSLEHDDREVFATAGQGDLRSTVLSVYGREVAEAMVPVCEGDDLATDDVGDADDGGGGDDGGGDTEDSGDAEAHAASTNSGEGTTDVTVSGLVSHPETTRASREYVATFVNGRYVRSSTLREAVVEAYGGQLAADRYPFAVLFVDVPPASVDPNVHPRKLEIRFQGEVDVRRAVRDAVEDALLAEGLVRSSAPRGRSAPEETPVEPGGGAGDGEDGTAAGGGPGGDGGGGVTTSGGDAVADDGAAGGPDDGAASGPADRPAQPGGRPAGRRPAGGEAAAEDGPVADDGLAADGASTTGDGTPEGEPTASGDRKFRAPAHQATLGDDADEALGGEDRAFDTLPPMRVLGQVHDTYLVAETADGLVLVDQHAADERVQYERLREQFAGDTTAQVLADPVAVSLTAVEAADLEAHREALARLGFRTEIADDGQRAVVKTVPAVLNEALDPDDLRDVLSEVVAADRSGAETVAALADHLLADLACYPAVTGNTPLSEGDVTALLAALDDCENPYACPHGRPVVIQLSSDELDDRFERDYPGHP